MHFIIPTVHLIIDSVLSFLQSTVKTAFAHLLEMSLQFDGSSSVVFIFSAWSFSLVACMSDLAVFTVSFLIPTHCRINNIKTMFGYSPKHCSCTEKQTKYVEPVGLKCYNVLHFQIWNSRPLRYVDKMAAVQGGKCPSVHTQVLDCFECATEVLPVHTLRFGTLCVFAQSALNKVSVSVEVRDFRHSTSLLDKCD